jgi:hypothetical protein
MDKQFERIQEILGKDLERNHKNVIKYRAYLNKAVTKPCILTGIEDFSWEEPYILGGWDQAEYNELKKSNPSFTDHFELIEFLTVKSEEEDIFTKVKRLSDKNIFEIELSWLECTDFKNENYQFIHDYAVWHTNC